MTQTNSVTASKEDSLQKSGS